ncbi:uncharacterized protein LOC131853828 [Achroia grisella]|uniref:uncharacterized protein LOC131853828 n=1 Tax=Achroia grisella TaxID=688607 RepID=UPI0027D2B329|nr:uncharacterized protein LOC131853828 [Achroia grisella]
MDGSHIEHSGSDSDSGESWTILEASPGYSDGVPELPENAPEGLPHNRDTIEVIGEKDEDTDGISIISDSDPETSFPCEINYHTCLLEEALPTDQQNTRYFSVNPLASNCNTSSHNKSVKSEEDFLGDNSGIHKTYVHRRNKRLSTVLNIIVLVSVITAAGVAIGHMWGVKNDCTMQSIPSVNKILSNLYKLQEENAYLRSKLKELTLVNNLQIKQKKVGSEKWLKQNKCKKVFEESLSNRNVDTYTKCVDINHNANVQSHVVVGSDYEKDILNINQLKPIGQNKSLLDDEILKKTGPKKQIISKHMLESLEKKPFKDMNLERQLKKIRRASASSEPLQNEPLEMSESDKLKSEKKISYSDSLQMETKGKIFDIRDTNIHTDDVIKEYPYKYKVKKIHETISEYSISGDEELKKDDRYIAPRHKQEKKKHDRQKSHKKQKRKNKYEQWQMKGGYLKDYDVLSISSSESAEIQNNSDQQKSKVNDNKNNVSIIHESDENIQHVSSIKPPPKGGRKLIKGKTGKDKNATWFDNRALFRMEARKKLNFELFGEISSNTAGWYFRRMQRREHCRAKGDNTTHRKLTKRNMNFKMKH